MLLPAVKQGLEQKYTRKFSDYTILELQRERMVLTPGRELQTEKSILATTKMFDDFVQHRPVSEISKMDLTKWLLLHKSNGTRRRYAR